LIRLAAAADARDDQAVAEIRHREPERCRRFINEIEPLSGVHVGTRGICFGVADHLLALLNDAVDEPDRADECFARAVEQHAAISSPAWVARLDELAVVLTRTTGIEMSVGVGGEPNGQLWRLYV
jgi:hypothetical protein